MVPLLESSPNINKTPQTINVTKIDPKLYNDKLAKRDAMGT
jgi:hypothetical protein